MRTILRVVIVLAVVFGSFLANASVSLKNGNFFVGYTDLLYSGGYEPKIERVYNSKSSHDGIFGFGWGSEYEVFLTVSPDGSVVVHENGGGAHNRFTPPRINTADVDKAVTEILNAKRKLGAGVSGSVAANEKERLRNDARYRNDEWERLFVKGLVKPKHLPDGTVLRSNKFSYQILTKSKNGYVRKSDNGKVESFSNAGKLVRVADRNGNFINLSYNKTGQLVQIQDNLNRRIHLEFNRAGKVEKIKGEGGKTAYYKYNGFDLTYSKDTDGNVYEYIYSTNGRHNLIGIKYKDNTKMEIAYNDVSKGETVSYVKERDGMGTEYIYGGDSIGGYHFFTKTKSKNKEGNLVKQATYEYWEKSKADGERYTYKMFTDIDGDKTETIFNECCGMPIEITHNSEKTSFEYDQRGHVTKKVTPSEVTELRYDTKTSKISRVARYPKNSRNKADVIWANYKYDAKGNLVAANNSQGKAVRLVYDFNGRIKAMVDQNKRRLEFKYNEANRPVEIKDPSLGKINVSYKNSGEILKVQSSGGRNVASSVTAAFQNLLDIIRPAGVTLSF
ncbi:MAG: DUF6531 domain-containing protein [Bacteriovoracia bacterium]